MKKNQKSTLGRSGKCWNAEVGMPQHKEKSPEQELRKGHWTQQSSSRAALKSPFRAGDRKTVK